MALKQNKVLNAIAIKFLFGVICLYAYLIVSSGNNVYNGYYSPLITQYVPC